MSKTREQLRHEWIAAIKEHIEIERWYLSEYGGFAQLGDSDMMLHALTNEWRAGLKKINDSCVRVAEAGRAWLNAPPDQE